jgi:hypothetical protein
VEDAMYVAINLDIPFLWVDRYCIDRANSEEKHDLIRNMDRIYEGAEITIIAATGDDPHHSLQGVRGTPRTPQPTLRVCGKAFVAAQEIAGQIQESTWSERGWTYQEMLLSRRRLVFTNSQMYFQYTMMHSIGSLTLGVTETSGSFGALYRVFPHRGIGHRSQDLIFRLIEYYKRKLLFKTDILHAFSGILNAFNNSEYFHNKVTHFCGIPIIHNDEQLDSATISFTRNLMWEIKDWDAEDSNDDVLSWNRRDIFSSWSWASAKARQGDNTSGHLTHDFRRHTDDLPWLETDLHVHVRHVGQGDMDLSAFVVHNDGYEHFLPHIDLTSWVLEFNIPPNATTVNIMNWSVPLTYRYRGSKICVIYIGLYRTSGLTLRGTWRKDYYAKGIIVREIEPGVYCRVKLWSEGMSDSIRTTRASVEQMLAYVLRREKERHYHDGMPSSIFIGQWRRWRLRIV